MHWPELDAARDGPTIATLHLASQMVGKVAIALLPWRNHGWHLTLRLHPRGLRTEPLHGPGGTFELGLDLVDHALTLDDAHGRHVIALGPTSIAELHGRLCALLAETHPDVRFHPIPNEIEPAVPFAEDEATRSYDPDSAARLLGALLASDRVLRLFRSGFLGKASPVHFFWGSFDLAVTRFSGRRAPLHPGGIPHLPDPVTQEAYSHEVSSAGFWPGGAGDAAAGIAPFFYSYAYPAPEGFADAPVNPAAARFDTALGEFVLPYEAVRSAADPDAALLAFLETSYAAAADLARWNRAALECALGRPRVPRPLG
ncbi:hypothetical protein E2493_17445 [Sphingomonas parva]|uniref:Ava_C0101 and related proteins n=1 Tax=Sphingomonas parva TaxID=2555898 RepID=A0A4Y8ZLV2_9SPHN|nr:DUF5996 family protein [Sphingomonas parva]TFI56978.1 hypothetical protein E2493_17445 [Sphingomonas parva]